MGVKIEWILLFAVIVTAIFSLSFKADTVSSSKADKKELEFFNAKLQEVDTKGLLSTAEAKSGVQVDGVLSMQHIFFDKIDNTKVWADKAIYKDSNMTLIDNVKIKQSKGYLFRTNKAIYDSKQKKIFAPNRYIATNANDTMTGYDLVYDTQKEEAVSKKIHAIFMTK